MIFSEVLKYNTSELQKISQDIFSDIDFKKFAIVYI